jgi:small nuclear ribonucleoprotein (snRNP)-like protein
MNTSSPSLEINGTSLGTSSSNHNNPTREISKWLGKTLRVELIDGRYITGTLVCTDSEPNFILTKAEESWGNPGKY